MSFCIECGASNSRTSLFCEACGVSIGRSNNNLNPQVTIRQAPSLDFQAPIDPSSQVNRSHLIRTPPQRDPLKWVLASIFIPFFIYYYAKKNFDDMRLLNNKFHNTPAKTQDPTLMLILFIIFPPIVVYYKFQDLYHHLSAEHIENPKIPNGKLVILHTLGGILVIFLVFLFLVYSNIFNLFISAALVTVAFGIHLAYYHFHWQEELNLHIWRHQQSIDSMH